MDWTLYTYQSALVLAKRIGTTKNSSVLYTDIANTIDGGEASTSASVAASLTGCGADGGSLGVVINSTDPVYSSAAYTAMGYTPDGIIIKIVHSGGVDAGRFFVDCEMRWDEMTERAAWAARPFLASGSVSSL